MAADSSFVRLRARQDLKRLHSRHKAKTETPPRLSLNDADTLTSASMGTCSLVVTLMLGAVAASAHLFFMYPCHST